MSPTNKIYDQANLHVFPLFFHGLNIITIMILDLTYHVQRCKYIQFLEDMLFKSHLYISEV